MSSKTRTTATKEEATPALVPKLRFPEFRGGWCEMTFGELLDDIIDFRGRTPVKLGMEWGNGNITSLSANNVKNGFIDYKAECNLGSEELYQRWMGDVSLEKNDIVFTMEAPLGNALLLPDSRKYILSQRVVAFKTNSQVVNPFLVQLIWSEGFQDAISELSTGSTAKGINQKALKTVPVKVPHPKEQQKIAECLSSVDELMAAQARKVDALKTHKKGLMQQLFPREGETQPRLRFPEFQNAGEWEESTVEEIIVTVTPPKKLQTSDYQSEGEFPIVDQSQDYICGWTNDGEAVIDKGLPVIVFGDHTCALKFIDRPFAQGADGIKILRPKRGIDIRFLFCALEANPVVQETYKRHFSMLREKKLSFPNPKSGEQQRIADCLTSLDDLIAAQTQKHAALKTHKQGLMQQLFPSPEEVAG